MAQLPCSLSVKSSSAWSVFLERSLIASSNLSTTTNSTKTDDIVGSNLLQQA
jgi:hypothetical protein